jgi:hypothetical protein
MSPGWGMMSALRIPAVIDTIMNGFSDKSVTLLFCQDTRSQKIVSIINLK